MAFLPITGGMLTPASGTATSAGNNTLVTPTSGKRLRIFYISVNPAGIETIGFRFGAAGSIFFLHVVPATSIVAKDFGDHKYIEGAVDEAFIMNMVGTTSTRWNLFYTEV